MGSSKNISKLIDHTILRPDATYKDIKRYCQEVEQYDFYSVCVAPCWIETAKELLKTKKVGSVAGFPLGFNTLTIKISEIEEVIALGADEIDTVANIGMIVEGKYDVLYREVEKMVAAAQGRVIKVIIETPLLKKEMIKAATEVLINGGVDFVKSGTGFYGPVKLSHVREMVKAAKNKIGVKAAGGIRNFKKAVAMVNAGANRIGTSTGVEIINAS